MSRERKKSEPFVFRFKDIDNNYLGELLREERSNFSIFLWFVVFLVMIGFCVYIVYELLVQYFEYASYNLEYTQPANKYTLPAITICSLNKLNYTKLDEKKLYPAYKDWIGNVKDRNSSSDDTETEKNDDLDQEDINTKFRMEIDDAVVSQTTTFAKEPTNYKAFTSLAYTANGLCLEMNDKEQLVQRVNGAVGGLTLVLDALTHHYLPETEEAGFMITLRMPNETVLSQEYGILVSPGKEYHINLQTRSVTRKSEPWGNCKDTADIFDDEGNLSFKECYLNQMLWMYPKLRHLGCGCYPWFFYERYIEDPEDSKYEPNIGWKLIRYWTEELSEEYRLDFNDTCTYDESGYRPNSKLLGKETGVQTVKDCAVKCKNRAAEECRYFLYSATSNDVLGANECWLYKKGAAMSAIAKDTSTKGLIWGDTQCYNMEKCSLSVEAQCQNKIMNALMRLEDENEKDEYDKSRLPPTCYEPCSYSEYRYEISNSEYPTSRYWNSYLSKQVKQYKTYEDAKSNLLKLVFYTDQMSTIEVIQTPSYEITSFIAELGGLTDLFIGLSFFTACQFLEWIITKTVRKVLVERRTMDKSDDVHIEDANL